MPSKRVKRTIRRRRSWSAKALESPLFSPRRIPSKKAYTRKFKHKRKV